MIQPKQLKIMRVAVLGRNLTEVAADLGTNRMMVKRTETGVSSATAQYIRTFADTYGITPETVAALQELEKAVAKAQSTRKMPQQMRAIK